ncbi:hypothetical protein GCM10023085_34450 [Actinomadura viridis]|uniref:Uncharacterized protein n=1 Tax=Actinomadura viridis TaxID=58110 RepID=A0A931DIA2_9ACTN|nr:hypothetical protein [Actinomadura viridis]MBG6088016.1 hypothetical protein [Actinomadura viridis]
MRARVRNTALALTLGGVPLLTFSPAPALASEPGTLVVERDGPARSLAFTAARDGEAVIGFTAAAPGVSWARAGAESAVLSVELDGRHVTDLVVPGADPTPRSLGLGPVRQGEHRVTLRFLGASAPAARRVILEGPAVRVPEADQVALRHAPIVVGRTGWPLGDPYQNARTDTPLIAWHESRPAAAPGHRVLEYSVVWSHEDGGTDGPALMARWGRTTDVEWVYRVEVDATGRRVDGTGVYQGPQHLTLKFRGRYEGDHPLLQTCTSNNNMCDVISPGAPLRFLPDASGTRPADRAREVVMDREPWTYRIMAQEMLREGRIERPSDPATRAVGDPRAYLFAELAKRTGAPATGWGSAPGVSLGVRLKDDPSRLYRSDHGERTWSIERDGPAATTVELPRGTTAGDIASIEAVRQPVGLGDNGAPATVTAIHRGFFLDRSYLPRPSAVRWNGSVTLTPQAPTAVLWTSPSP